MTEQRNVAHGLVEVSGEVLLLHRADGRYLGNFWDIPGGTVEPGETPMEAAVRECYEEAGINCEATAEIAHYENLDTEGRDINFHTVTYRLRPIGSCDVLMSHEHQGFQWATPAAALQLPLVWHVERTLRAFVEAQDRVLP